MNEVLKILGSDECAETVLDVEVVPGLKVLPGERKVRRMFIFPTGELLTIATDRIGAFDQPHLTEDGKPAFYPGKGIITTNFALLGKKESKIYMPTDLCPIALYMKQIPREFISRSSVSLMADYIIPVEFIVRSTNEGSLAKKAKEGKECCGQTLPEGIRLGQSLGRPYFTPTTKAPKGEKDKDLSIDEYYQAVGSDVVANYLYGMAVLLHLHNRCCAKLEGLDRPDQKFEFGIFHSGLNVAPSKLMADINYEKAEHIFNSACELAGLPKSSWENMPGFDLDAFQQFAKRNATTGIYRLVDETWGTDDGRYRSLEDTKMGLLLYAYNEFDAAELFMKNYLCKEYFRSESKRTGKGGYDEEAGQSVIIPTPVLQETGRRNLMAYIRMAKIVQRE